MTCSRKFEAETDSQEEPPTHVRILPRASSKRELETGVSGDSVEVEARTREPVENASDSFDASVSSLAPLSLP